MNTRDEKNDGGPAFPRIRSHVDTIGCLHQESDGMALRDWFAGQALPEVMNTRLGLIEQSKRTGDSPATIAARVAYEYANAMLKARTAE